VEAAADETGAEVGATAVVVGATEALVAGAEVAGGEAEAEARRSGQTFGSSASVVEISAEVQVERTQGVAAEVMRAWLEAEQMQA